ncbi:acyl-CoA dehydrogenase family protein [Tropicibacter sp. Alg240-R139]|uniref:acyl-CoA dehydrogenase family protein n=1 Tax=Tropicibacter sp. Alg240-R139 TaxID=2305991 RepID=UPI0013E0519A|nr:acyl-CoA dehydrogenase family protein [Tropicibacter sp. Alg240-R139]
MDSYTAPLEDMKYVLWDLLQGEDLLKLPDYSDFSASEISMVLEEAGKFCTNVLAPINSAGDQHGCQLEAGTVRTPPGFAEAYALYREGGWPGLLANPDDGGQGLPHSVQVMTEEMSSAANLAFTGYSGLTLAAYQTLREHGSPEQKALCLEHLASGHWTGTMCLTEPQCGSDLSMVRTRAEPTGDETYKIFGTKIFITSGDHDLSENIVHLVLARLPDAPVGTKGLSLFLVPKFAIEAPSRLGAPNNVVTVAVEHKMGSKGSATCQLSFEGALGTLIGEPHKGMSAMFSMMNISRLSVATQGLSTAEAALQAGLGYARTRLQGRSAAGDGSPEPIIRHADVKRMLLTMKSLTEGMRALTIWIAIHTDLRYKHPDPKKRAEAEDFISLLTPIAKAFCTDAGFTCANLAVQIHGGHGYIRETGIEQLVRDSRISSIYEGTNGIQAIDLVARKVLGDGGRRLSCVFAPIEQFLDENAENEKLAPMVSAIATSYQRLRSVTDLIAQSPSTGIVGAQAYLNLFGLVLLGYLWGRMVVTSADRPEPFHMAKQATARFFFTHILSQADYYASVVEGGEDALVEYEEQYFG